MEAVVKGGDTVDAIKNRVADPGVSDGTAHFFTVATSDSFRTEDTSSTTVRSTHYQEVGNWSLHGREDRSLASEVAVRGRYELTSPTESYRCTTGHVGSCA